MPKELIYIVVFLFGVLCLVNYNRIQSEEKETTKRVEAICAKYENADSRDLCREREMYSILDDLPVEYNSGY